MNTEELNVLNQFEFLYASCEKLIIENELIDTAKMLYDQIVEIRQRLAEIDNDMCFNQ